MKKLFILLIITLLLSSCSEVVLDESQRADATTVALQNVAKADSTNYHVVFNDDDMVVMDENYIVIAKGIANTGRRNVSNKMLLVLLGFTAGFILAKL